MKISVIIPTYNRKNALVQTLESLSQQSYKDFEVILVDDGSTDGTKEIIKKFNFPFEIQYIFQQNKGPASARNIGIKKAKGEIIFFTGDDIILSSDLLKEHLRIYQIDSKKLAVLGYTQWAPQIRMTPFRKYVADYHFAYSSIIDKQNVNWGCFYTSNISIQRRFLEEVGLFDEEFLYAAYEDTELAYRLFKKGMKIVFNKKAIAYHNHPVDFKSYQKTMFNRGVATIALGKKVPPLRYKVNYKETKNLIRLFFKKMIFNKLIMFLIVRIINILDKLMIPLSGFIYYKIMNYYRIQGIKTLK